MIRIKTNQHQISKLVSQTKSELCVGRLTLRAGDTQPHTHFPSLDHDDVQANYTVRRPL